MGSYLMKNGDTWIIPGLNARAKFRETSTKVVQKLKSVAEDEVQCDQISKSYNSKLREFVRDLDGKREKFVVLREAEVTNMFEEMAQTQIILSEELLKQTETSGNLRELSEALKLF